MKKRRHLGDVLAASWLVLEASWGVPKSMGAVNAAARGRGGGDAGATPRKDSERIRIIRKEYHKEVSKERMLEYGTPYAMRRHKAWRGGYPKRSKAAYPPPRCVLDHKLNGFIYSCAEFMVDEK